MFADWLVENWDSYPTYDSRKKAFWRHCTDIKTALSDAGVDNWLPSAFTVVLEAMPTENGSMVDQLFSTRPFCKRKNALISDLRDGLHGEWNLDLAQYALVDVGLSVSQYQYQSLRNAFSKSLYAPKNTVVDDMDPRAGMYSKRPWYTCPVTHKTYHLPEPLPPYYRAKPS